MVFGTFDVLHKGHLHFFKQARALSQSPYLIVSIARDVNVKKIKGRKPLHSERQRLKALNNLGLAQKVVLGGLSNHLSHILKERPNIIALGYDQTHYVKGLRLQLRKKGLEVKIRRLKPFKRHLYKSSIIKSNLSL